MCNAIINYFKMKMPVNKTITGAEMKPISVSNANATWENVSSKINYYETYSQEENVQVKSVKEKYSFITEWTVYNNDIVKPVYEYKSEDDFIIEW